MVNKAHTRTKDGFLACVKDYWILGSSAIVIHGSCQTDHRKKQLDKDQERKETKPVVVDEVRDGGQLPRLIAEMIDN